MATGGFGRGEESCEPGAAAWFGRVLQNFSENAEKLIPPHLGSSLDPWSPVRGNHLFELSGLKMPKR